VLIHTSNVADKHRSHRTYFNYRTPLFIACQYGSVKLVEKIIATGAAKIDQADQDNWSPLFIASLRGHTKVVEKLLEVGADPEIRENRNGWTPFLASCFAGHVDIARMLIAHAAKIGSY
jgi:ankyrin repeat protein